MARKIQHNFLAGFQALRHNLLRSFLTIAGIVVGIAAVVTVLAIGKGNEAKIQAQIERMGASTFWIEPNFSTPSALTPGRIFTSSTSQNRSTVPARALSFQDSKEISRHCTAVKYNAPVTQYADQVSHNGAPTQIDIIATTPAYQRVKALHVVNGRYLTESDMFFGKKVCVIEEQAGLFDGNGVVRKIRIRGHIFEVVGTYRRKNAIPAPFRSLRLHIPYTTAVRTLGKNEVHRIDCLAQKGGLKRAMQQTRDILLARRRGKADYVVRTPRDFFRQAEEITQTATLVTAGIGMLSLFVGGIGIMNILLASVLERTREVGIRKAVGARKRDILWQFLFESLLFSLAGGVLGIVLGFSASELVGKAIDMPTVITWPAVLVAAGFSALIGLVFGVYPAWKAALLPPIEALRSA